ncbi:MAG: hypothetical protein ACREIP_14840, partial [Alphaproteobacteria bacterium]
VIAIAAASTAAAAQQRGGALCKDGALPFDATAGNRLSGTPLQQALAGKKLGYLRESLRTSGVWVNNARELRTDGSLVYTCEFSRSPSGPWSPCTSFGSTTKQASGARDVGVWSVKNNALCMTGAAFGESSESCFAIHRQGSAVAAKRVSGPQSVCIEGAITLQ